MLINATQEEELRMAMVDGQQLYDLNIELPASERKKANIYKGQITRIEPSLEAAFVNYGADRHGFLPLKEISSEYFVAEPSGSKPNIRDVLKEGQDIVVQIDKEERGNKGAALTTYVSLAGRFIVLKPNKARSGGVSRRIVGEDRDLARSSLREVDIPSGMSVILRTAGIDRSAEELAWDLENLLSVWEAIKKVVVERNSPFLIYRESNAVVRALRDYLMSDIGEILVDDEATYKEAREFVEQVMPQNLRKLKLYEDSVPLFTRYQIETQIESAFAHSVTLPSGGSIVIDHTEALVSIDINSARATKGGDIEATALNTNLESADEIARQLRLRDLGGLVVIDFIDMGPQKNQREVENRLRDAVRQDRARVQLGKISRFGLLEMSRQRLRPSLGESSYLVCPRCSGIGNIRSVESLALAILRIIGEEARKERTAKVIAQLPVEVATYLLNEKRDWVQGLETRHGTQVILVANPALETPHYQIRRVRDDQVDLPENVGISYTLAESEDEPEITQAMQDKKEAEIAAITTIVTTTPAPPRKEPVKTTGPGLFERIAAFFSGSADKEKKPAQKKRTRKTTDSRRRGSPRGPKRADGQRQQTKKTSQRAKQGSKKQQSKKTGGQDASRSEPQQSRPKPEQRDDSRPDGRQGTSKRRSRGGRRRRRGSEAKDAAETNGNQVATEQTPDNGPAQDKAEKPAARRQAQSGPRSDKPDADKAVTADSPKVDVPKMDVPKSDAPKAEAPKADTPKAAENAGPAKSERIEKPSDKPRPEPVAAKPETKDVPKAIASEPVPKAAAEKPARPDSFEDTHPSLPKLVVSNDDAPAKPVKKPEAGNGESKVAKPNGPASGTGEKNPGGGDKPAGRLLPWEPGEAGSSGPTDKD
jgi:ribonuclease E